MINKFCKKPLYECTIKLAKVALGALLIVNGYKVKYRGISSALFTHHPVSPPPDW